MIALNKDLTKIWNNIVNSNAKIGRMDDPTSLEEKVNVPLTPFQINVYLFYRLYELLYSKFINDQLNLIDIIVSDYDIDNIVLAIYIYDMKKVGIHDNIKKITLEKLKVKQSELKDLPTLFEKIRAIVMEESSLSISSMRIFKKLSIDLMNRLHETINKLSLEDYLKELIKFIEKVLQETLISFYPEPKSVRFISQALRFFDNFDLISIWDIFHKFIPNIKNVLLFKYKDLYFSLSINRTLREDKTPSLELKINEEKNLNFKQFYRTYLETQLKKVYERENNSNVLSIDLEILIDFVFDLFNYDLPIEKVDFILILQSYWT
jgi:hypothetical protein